MLQVTWLKHVCCLCFFKQPIGHATQNHSILLWNLSCALVLSRLMTETMSDHNLFTRYQVLRTILSNPYWKSCTYCTYCTHCTN